MLKFLKNYHLYISKVCYHTCKECIEYNTKCTVCQENSNRLTYPKNFKCDCIDGFFDQGFAICVCRNNFILNY